jgi:hypothetical protein
MLVCEQCLGSGEVELHEEDHLPDSVVPPRPDDMPPELLIEGLGTPRKVLCTCREKPSAVRYIEVAG